ncbi:MAG: hypothetical protein ACRDRO_06385 [Pseudonocardiaceae bacterium]
MTVRVERVELAHGLVAELHCRESASPHLPVRTLPVQKSQRATPPADPHVWDRAVPPPAPRTGMLERDTYYAD